MEYLFDVTYDSRGYMVVEADSWEEAKHKARHFDCIRDTVLESSFDTVDLNSCEVFDFDG
jgi:hypothetical protein